MWQINHNFVFTKMNFCELVFVKFYFCESFLPRKQDFFFCFQKSDQVIDVIQEDFYERYNFYTDKPFGFLVNNLTFRLFICLCVVDGPCTGLINVHRRLRVEVLRLSVSTLLYMVQYFNMVYLEVLRLSVRTLLYMVQYFNMIYLEVLRLSVSTLLFLVQYFNMVCLEVLRLSVSTILYMVQYFNMVYLYIFGFLLIAHFCPCTSLGRKISKTCCTW